MDWVSVSQKFWNPLRLSVSFFSFNVLVQKSKIFGFINVNGTSQMEGCTYLKNNFLVEDLIVLTRDRDPARLSGGEHLVYCVIPFGVDQYGVIPALSASHCSHRHCDSPKRTACMQGKI